MHFCHFSPTSSLKKLLSLCLTVAPFHFSPENCVFEWQQQRENTTYYQHLLFLANPNWKISCVCRFKWKVYPFFEKELLNSSVRISFTQKKRPIQFTCMKNSDVAKKYNNKIQSQKKKKERKKSTRY